MTTDDIEQVIEIENESFLSPWSKEDLIRELTDNPFSTYLVEQRDEKVAGYIGFWITFDSAQICNIAVRKEYREKGIGQLMMDACISKCEMEGCEYLTLEVRRSNQKAINLYEKNGFILANIKEGYYVDNHEDALYMVRPLKVEI